MRRHTAVWLLSVAVLAMALFAGCGKSEESEKTQPQTQPSAQPMPGQAPGRAPTGMPPGAFGQMPGASGQQQMQVAPAQPTEPAEAALSGSGYQERYKQGDLTAEELRQEHELQKVERELGYPVGPE